MGIDQYEKMSPTNSHVLTLSLAICVLQSKSIYLFICLYLQIKLSDEKMRFLKMFKIMFYICFTASIKLYKLGNHFLI